MVRKQYYRVKCKRCGYIWKTRSRLRYLTCPNCQYKVKRRLRKNVVDIGGVDIG